MTRGAFTTLGLAACDVVERLLAKRFRLLRIPGKVCPRSAADLQAGSERVCPVRRRDAGGNPASRERKAATRSPNRAAELARREDFAR